MVEGVASKVGGAMHKFSMLMACHLLYDWQASGRKGGCIPAVAQLITDGIPASHLQPIILNVRPQITTPSEHRAVVQPCALLNQSVTFWSRIAGA